MKLPSLFLSILFSSTSLYAITIRTDRVDLLLDRNNLFPNVSQVNNGCTGSLINSRTVLFAGHCIGGNTLAAQKRTAATMIDGPVSFAVYPDNETTVYDRQIANIVFHENYGTKYGPSFMDNDLAIAVLDQPITGLSPVTLGTTAPAPGTLAWLVGYGLSGTGDNPASDEEYKRRVAENTIDFAGVPREGTIGEEERGSYGRPDNQQIVMSDFDAPGTSRYNSTGSATPLNREGTTARGDSGGPIFARIIQNGVERLFQVGVTSYGHGAQGGVEEGYGDIAVWQALWPHIGWLNENSPLRSMSSTSSGNWSNASLWKDSYRNALVGRINQVPHNYITNAPAAAINYPKIAQFFDVSIGKDHKVQLDASPTIDKLTVSGMLTVPTSRRMTVLTTTDVPGVMDMRGGRLSSTSMTVPGVLQGSGTVDGPVNIRSGGSVNPDGRLIINGPLTLEAGSSFVAMTAPGLLQVNNRATLGSGTLKVAGNVTAERQVISAQTLSSSFSKIVSLNGRSYTTRVNGTNIFLVPGVRSRALEDSSSLADSSDAFNSLFDEDVDLSEFLTELGFESEEDFIESLGIESEEDLIAFLDEFFPENEEDSADLSSESISTIAGHIENRLDVVEVDGGELDTTAFRFMGSDVAVAEKPKSKMAKSAPRWGAFLAGDLLWSKRSGSTSSRKFFTTGVTAGVDYRLSSRYTVGASLSFVNDTGKVSRPGERLQAEAYIPTLYASARFSPVTLKGYFSYGFFMFDNGRVVGGQVARSNPRAYQMAGGLSGDYAFKSGDWSFGPLASVSYSQMKTDDYREIGAGPLNLESAASRTRRWTASLGGQVSRRFTTSWGSISPRLKVALVRDFGLKGGKPTLNLVAAPTRFFTSSATPSAGTYGIVNFGLSIKGKSTSATVGYETDINRKNNKTHKLSFSFKLNW